MFNSYRSILASIVLDIRGFLFVGENYMSWPLWYLLALIVAVFIIRTLLIRNLSIEMTFLISLAISMLGKVMDYYNSIPEMLPTWLNSTLSAYYNVFGSTRNAIFVGFCLVSLGLLVGKYLKNLTQFSWAVLAFLTCVAICWHLSNLLYSVFLLIPCIIIIFMKAKITAGVYDVKLRSMSSLIYFTHMVPVGLLQIANLDMNSLLLYVISAIVTTCLGFTLLQIDKNRIILKRII